MAIKAAANRSEIQDTKKVAQILGDLLYLSAPQGL